MNEVESPSVAYPMISTSRSFCYSLECATTAPSAECLDPRWSTRIGWYFHHWPRMALEISVRPTQCADIFIIAPNQRLKFHLCFGDTVIFSPPPGADSGNFSVSPAVRRFFHHLSPSLAPNPTMLLHDCTDGVNLFANALILIFRQYRQGAKS